jgi:hypothetical protein
MFAAIFAANMSFLGVDRCQGTSSLVPYASKLNWALAPELEI